MNRTERVVLVDDNEMDNIYHEFVLKGAGFAGDLRIYDSGPLAIEAMANLDLEKRTLILLDINMPGMDGFEVAQKLMPILADEPGIALMMLTSSEASEDVARARAIPSIKGYLTKPLSEAYVAELMLATDWDELRIKLEDGRFWP